MGRKYADLRERIIANSILSNDSVYDGTPCWLWIGKRSANGDYGHINLRIDGKHRTFKAHRVSLHAFRGASLDDPKVGMHRCNVRLCVNPMHLEYGTQSENIRQCVADGRHRSFQNRKELEEVV